MKTKHQKFKNFEIFYVFDEIMIAKNFRFRKNIIISHKKNHFVSNEIDVRCEMTKIFKFSRNITFTLILLYL